MSIIEITDKYIMNSYARNQIEIIQGKNSTCQDKNGKKYIDFTSGIGVNSLGFCNDKWYDAILKQASSLQHISNLYYTSPSATLAKVLCEETGFTNVFFANSGAEANEGAIKIARKYSFDKYGKDRNKIISLNQSFHGRTMATLTATGQDTMHDFFFPFMEGFVFAKANDFKSVEALIDDSICAIMIEVIQGEGGVILLNKDFIEQVNELCKSNDILLIVDEVQTGIGRTGELLASMHFDIQPDITTLAKGLGGGLPIGAILASKKCSEVLSAGTHGSTFGANPVVCAGALAVLDVIKQKYFLQEVKEKAEFMCQEILKMKNVLSISGKGLMIGIEIENKIAKDCVQECMKAGLLCLTAKEKIRLLPPLNISYDEINEGLAILNEVLSSKGE